MSPVEEIQTFAAAGADQARGRIDSSFSAHPKAWGLILLATGFFLRLWHASGTFLNSDEVMHFAAANQSSWLETYKVSLTISHPPLLILIEHLWRYLGTSELMLRMPSILAGTAFCWLTFRWAAMLFSSSVAWTIYAFVLYLPSSIELATEIRQYALFLAFLMGTAYWLERGLRSNSAASIALSGVSLWLAIASHFSAFLLAPALGIYALSRMLGRKPATRVVAAWIFTQAVALGMCVFLYLTQIRGLSRYFGGQDATRGWMGNAYLSHSYFIPGKVNPLVFLLGRTIGVFQFTFRQLAVGDLAFLFFVAGLVLLWRSHPRPPHVSSRQLFLLLVVPFAINGAAALAGAYPYGGTRHSSLLIPFALAGVAIALDRILNSRVSAGILAAVLVSLLCRFSAARELPYVAPEAQRAGNMRAAIDFIHRLPAGEPVFADVQTNLLLGHYLCGGRRFRSDRSIAGFVSYECGGHHVIASTTQYIFTARSLYDQWQEMVARFGLRPGSRVWVAQMGWYTYAAFELANFPELNLKPRNFGPQIQIFDLRVGQTMPDRALLPAK